GGEHQAVLEVRVVDVAARQTPDLSVVVDGPTGCWIEAFVGADDRVAPDLAGDLTRGDLDAVLGDGLRGDDGQLGAAVVARVELQIERDAAAGLGVAQHAVWAEFG